MCGREVEAVETEKSGGSDRKSKVAKGLQAYWILREEFSVVNGMQFKRECSVVPEAIKQEMLSNQLLML